MNAAAPPPGGYGPPGGGGYGPPQGGGFGGPPPGGGGFGGPPPGGGGFGAPPGAPPPGGAFGAPPAAPGGYAQPVPAYGAAPGGGVSPELQKMVDKWSMISMITFAFGCGIFALIPIMMSNNAKEALRRGDAATAQSKIGTVKILCILGFVNVGFWLLMTVVYVIFMIIMSM